MSRKLYKKIELENGSLSFYGGNRFAELSLQHTGKHEGDSFFFHYGRKYYLGEFTCVGKFSPECMKEFDGYLNDSFFSGVVIKLSDCGEAVKAYTFY